MDVRKRTNRHGLKTEMTESFLSGMKGLFEEHYVTIPEDKYDVLESMVEKLDEMETKLNEQIDRNVSLNKGSAESTAVSVIDQVSEGLLRPKRRKLLSLSPKVLSLKVKKNIVKNGDPEGVILLQVSLPLSRSPPDTVRKGVDTTVSLYQ